MPNGLLPPGTRAYFLGSAASIDELGAFMPLEEGAIEGTLMLARLDFAEFPEPSSLEELNSVLSNAGVVPWPGYPYIVYASATEPAVFLHWTKGIAWLPIIIGGLATIVLPPLLGAGLWLIIPDPVKNMIESLFSLGMMALVMFAMVKMIPALMPREEKPEEIKEKAR